MWRLHHGYFNAKTSSFHVQLDFVCYAVYTNKCTLFVQFTPKPPSDKTKGLKVVLSDNQYRSWNEANHYCQSKGHSLITPYDQITFNDLFHMDLQHVCQKTFTGLRKDSKVSVSRD